jgi:hypothetical protein
VQLKLAGVDDVLGAASGTGTLVLVGRSTFSTSAESAATNVEVPIDFPFSMVGGQAHLRTSVNARLIAQDTCLRTDHSVEWISVSIFDSTGNLFARPGLYLAGLANGPGTTPLSPSGAFLDGFDGLVD